MMGLYASCWSFIELHLIPEGAVKWFYLSFYVHPLLLIPCFFFLWLKALKEFFSVVVFLFLDSVNLLVVYIYGIVLSAAVYFFSFFRVRSYGSHSRETNFEPAEVSDDYQVFRSFSFFCQAAPTSELKVFPTQYIDCKGEDANEYREASVDFDVFEEEEPRESSDINTSVDESLACSNLPAEEESLLPEVNASEEDVNNLTSPAVVWSWPEESASEEDVTNLTSPAVVWSWPESLPYDDDTSYSVEEKESESESNEYIPSPYEHLSAADMGVNEELASRYTTGFYCSELEWAELDEPATSYGANSVLLVREEPNTRKDTDPFYEKYIELMRWFDVVCYERMCGISAILEKKFEPATFSNPNLSWAKSEAAKRRLLKSLDSEFELVYVSQMCLSWEALHHQYRKFQELLTSSCPHIRVSGHTKLVGEFQMFQVLIERFLEEEQRCGGKRYLKFVEGKFSLKSLLHVPELLGFSEEEQEQNGIERRAVSELKEVAKTMEKCIKAFYLFVKADKDKSWWKFRSSLWSYPTVEDPRDMPLFDELTERHHKKVMLLKDLQGKKKCWTKRRGSVGPSVESQEKGMLFTTIDLKLVLRVLQMATISTSQLKWCRSKLDNINFREGKVTIVGTCPFFPTS